MSNALYTVRQYPCGCQAQGPGDVPNYCPEHGDAALASELLEALKGLLAECDRHGCFENVSFEFPSVKPFFDAARDAIAKAEKRHA